MERTTATFIRSWGVTFFLLMWFVQQWFRVSKQLADAEELQAIRQSVDKSLEMLQEQAEVAAAETPSTARITEPGDEPANPPNEEPIARVLAEVARSPKAALLFLGAELEKELRQLLWSAGRFQGVGKATITASVARLVEIGGVSKNLGGSVRAFLEIRNRLLHGYGVTDDEVIRAVDVGLIILQAILAIPREDNRVYDSLRGGDIRGSRGTSGSSGC